MSTATREDTVEKRTNASLIQVGDVFTRHSAGIITEVAFNDISVKNSEGKEWTISKAIVEAEFSFATHVQGDEIKLNQTEMIELIKENARQAMCITYNKKVEGKEVAKLLKEGQGDKNDRSWVQTVNKAMQGEERTLTGHHTNSFTAHGRLYFSCLGDTTGVRQVDLRTVSEITVNNTRYVLK
jgi:hypothetical protein